MLLGHYLLWCRAVQAILLNRLNYQQLNHCPMNDENRYLCLGNLMVDVCLVWAVVVDDPTISELNVAVVAYRPKNGLAENLASSIGVLRNLAAVN